MTGALSPQDAARYARQILLANVGRAGQERILSGVAQVACPQDAGEEPLRHRLAVRYARRAGFGTVSAAPLDLEALAPEALVKQPAAREVLAASRAVVVALRDALDVPADATREAPADKAR